MKRHFVKESKVSKFIAIIMVMALVASLAGCRGADPAPAAPPTAPAQDTTAAVTDAVDEAVNGNGAGMAEVGDWRIGIITGTVSQGEEEYLAGRNMEARFGSDRIVRTTYPDAFAAEMEVTIANVLSLVDAGADAIVFVQAVPGTIASIQATHEQFPEREVLFFAGVNQEPPTEVAVHADVIMTSDDLAMGRIIMEQAHRMGADTFGHISFPRHLGMENIAMRRSILQETAEELGIEWVELTAPDPVAEGVPAAQMFILENVPRWVAEHGDNIAFFSTNCAMQEPLMTQIASYGGLYPLQCCPSPLHAFPAAFNISMAGNEGDIEFLINAIGDAVADMGGEGRFSTWPVPINMLLVEVGVLYSIEFLEGRTNGRHDSEVLQRVTHEVAASYNATVGISNWPLADGGYIDNFYLIYSGFVTF